MRTRSIVEYVTPLSLSVSLTHTNNRGMLWPLLTLHVKTLQLITLQRMTVSLRCVSWCIITLYGTTVSQYTCHDSIAVDVVNILLHVMVVVPHL